MPLAALTVILSGLLFRQRLKRPKRDGMDIDMIDEADTDIASRSRAIRLFSRTYHPPEPTLTRTTKLCNISSQSSEFMRATLFCICLSTLRAGVIIIWQ